jgi:hypothetical protein
VKPNRTIFAFFGFGSGFIAALIITAFRHRLQPAIPLPTVSA